MNSSPFLQENEPTYKVCHKNPRCNNAPQIEKILPQDFVSMFLVVDAKSEESVNESMDR